MEFIQGPCHSILSNREIIYAPFSNSHSSFVMPLITGDRPPAYPEYLIFGTIETVCTLVIIWQAWTWSGVGAAVSSERIVRQPEAGITSS